MMEEENQYYWTDIESGVRFPCSKEYYEGMKRAWEECKPKLTSNSRNIGSVIITGTKGDIDYDKYIQGTDPISDDGKSMFVSFKPFKNE